MLSMNAAQNDGEFASNIYTAPLTGILVCWLAASFENIYKFYPPWERKRKDRGAWGNHRQENIPTLNYILTNYVSQWIKKTLCGCEGKIIIYYKNEGNITFV